MMFKKFLPLSIPLKFSFFVASLLIFTIAINTGFVLSYNNKIIRNSMETRARSIAASLSLEGTKVVDDNLYLIQEALPGFSSQPDISQISFIDDGNMITASNDISKIGETLSSDPMFQNAVHQKKEVMTYYKNPDGSEMLVTFEPMWLEGKIHGWIRLDLSLKEIQKAALKHSLWLVLLAVLFTGLAIFLTLGISRKISVVLNLLVTKFKKLAEGNFSEKLNIQTGDELEKVASSYNTLVEQMSSMVSQLEQKRQNTEEKLLNSQESLAHAQRIAHLGNWDFDLKKNEVIWSDEIYRIFGLVPNQFKGTYEAFLSFVHPGDREFVEKSVHQSLYEDTPYRIDFRIVLPDGSERIVHAQGEVFFSEAGEPVRMIGTVQDITNQKKAEERLNYLAYYDSLTGLPNRILFHDLLEKAILKAQKTKDSLSVLIIDLNRFKEINDTLGHHQGDLLLEKVGKRLKEILHPSDTLAHLGGDEFGILLSGVSGRPEGPVDQATRLARRILEVLKIPFEIGGLPIAVETGIGIALYPDHGENPETLIQKGDVAMYMSKKTGNEYTFYDPRQDQHSPTQLALMGELRGGIEKGELFLLYQPKSI
ncbi:MAG: diguanylate cyclase domain-containing protein [Nitrospiria bacterium]